MPELLELADRWERRADDLLLTGRPAAAEERRLAAHELRAWIREAVIWYAEHTTNETAAADAPAA